MNQKNQYDPYYQDPTGSQNTQTSNNPYMQNNHPSHRQAMHYTNTNDNEQAIYPYDEYDDQYDEDYEDEYDETSSHYDDPFVDMQKEPEEEKKKHRFFFWLIFLAALVVFLYSAFQLFKILKANWDEKREKDRIIEIGNIPEDPEQPFTINWEALKKENDQIKAWIIVPDTNISYPIVQGTDNDYYLHHTFGKQVNYAGAVFIDYHNKPDFSDNNTLIYGHNVKHETMFSQLEKFMDKQFFDDHKYVYLFTEQQNYKCEVVSFESTYDRSPSYRYGITDAKEWKDYIDLVTAPDLNGHVRSNVKMGVSDRMVSLSTCSYEINDSPSDRRYLMHLKLVPWIGQYKEDNSQGPSTQN